jgi:hypothetical protein
VCMHDEEELLTQTLCKWLRVWTRIAHLRLDCVRDVMKSFPFRYLRSSEWKLHQEKITKQPPSNFLSCLFRIPAYMEIPSGFSLGHIFALEEIWKLITSSTSRHILRGVYLKRARNMSLGV